MKNYQSAKWVVNRNAIDIVSRANLSGGGGFMARNAITSLSPRPRRPFMQPHSPIDARDYVGNVCSAPTRRNKPWFSKFGRELRYERPKHRRTDVTAYRQTDV